MIYRKNDISFLLYTTTTLCCESSWVRVTKNNLQNVRDRRLCVYWHFYDIVSFQKCISMCKSYELSVVMMERLVYLAEYKTMLKRKHKSERVLDFRLHRYYFCLHLTLAQFLFIHQNYHSNLYRYTYVYPKVGWKIHSLKSSYNEVISADPIYPTPPLGQDMTQGQFLSGV